jgi:tetratricopeptide (TPR) repeat protein
VATIASTTTIDYLFSSTFNQQSNYDALADSALSRGIDRYSKEDYAGAVMEFRRAIGLSPYSQNTSKSYDLMVQSLLKEDKTDEAISAYKQAIRLEPNNDTYHLNLGNINFSQSRMQEAFEGYKRAVQLNPVSATNLYSLGQSALSVGQYQEAEQAFKKVAGMLPGDADVACALGQTYRQMGNYREAVDQLNLAISRKKNFGDAYLELGLAYAGLEEMDMAEEQVKSLGTIDSTLQAELKELLYPRQQPRILLAYNTEGFLPSYGPGTPVSNLDRSLTTPGASKDFTLHFIFDKEMDAASVANPFNWNINRAPSGNSWGGYNWNLPLPATDAVIPPQPTGVVYHQDLMTADVTFRISQNEAGDATIDPSHVMFRFSGRDAYGNAMDLSADEYSGISMVV